LRLPVRENPSKQLFSPEAGKEKLGYLSPRFVYGKWAFSVDNCTPSLIEARPDVVPINHGYRYLGNVQSRWLSTGGERGESKFLMLEISPLPEGHIQIR
jgi:hypothetical protein